MTAWDFGSVTRLKNEGVSIFIEEEVSAVLMVRWVLHSLP